MKYKVLKITNNIEAYPEAKEDTLQYPNLINKVEDEFDLFIMNENGECYQADEFFNMIPIKEFEASVTSTW